jgi:transposase-like protein
MLARPEQIPLWDGGAWIVAETAGQRDVALRLAIDDDGTLVPTALVVGFTWRDRDTPPEPITPRVLRDITLGQLLDDCEHLRRTGDLVPPAAPPGMPSTDYDAWGTFRDEITVPRVRPVRQRRPGRAGRTDEHYTEFAAAWRAEVDRDRRTSPVARLAQHYDVSEATIRRWKITATERGLLASPSTPTRTRAAKPATTTRKKQTRKKQTRARRRAPGGEQP